MKLLIGGKKNRVVQLAVRALNQNWAVFFLLAMMCILASLGESVEYFFRYFRPSVLPTEITSWVSLFTCNFVHLNFRHFLLNASVFVMLPFLFNLNQRVLLILLTLLALLVGGGIHFFSPTVSSYVGFSGVLTGLLVYGFFHAFYSDYLSGNKEQWVWVVAVLFLTGKTVIEQLEGYDSYRLLDQIGGNIIVDSHLYGFLGGLVFSLLYLAFQVVVHRKRTNQNSFN